MKQITRKWYWYSIELVIFGALCLMDIMLTLIALNLPYLDIEEANPLAIPFVNNPYLLYSITFMFLFMYWVIGIILWQIDEKTEKTTDILTVLVMSVMLINIIFRLYAVINNILFYYFWLR